MGFLKSIGGALKKIGGGIVKGIAKFAKSKLGGVLMNVGLGMLTGGVGGIIGKGLSLLKNSGIGSKLMDVFGGVAKNFLGNASSMLSGGGQGTVSNFLQNMVGGGQQNGSSSILDTFKTMISNWSQPQQGVPPADPTTQQAAMENSQQMAAYYQAINLRQMMANQGYNLGF